MKLKSILMTAAALALTVAAHGEDVLQVQPFRTQPGVVSDDAASFSLMMTNTSADIWAFTFDILLPEGMEFDTEYEPFELNTERYPYTKDRRGNIVYQHTVVYDHENQEGRWWRVTVHTDEADRLTGREGEVLTAYFTTAADMAPGVYPIKVKNALLVIDGSNGIYPPETTSYVVVGDAPQLTAAVADFSCLEGYVPGFVVNQLSEDLAGNTALTALDLSGADELGAAPTLPNANALLLAKAGSEVATQPGAVADGLCPQLLLHDGGGNFCAPTAFTAAQAGFDRVFTAGYWSTVVLPFGLSTDQMEAIKSEGVEVERLAGYDEEEQMLHFEASESMEANVPYIVRVPEDTAPFATLGSVAVETATEAPATEVDGVRFCGTYERQTLSSDNEVTYYAYNSANGEFVRIGRNATVSPFRAVIAIAGDAASMAPTLRATHFSGTEGTTAVSLQRADNLTQQAYDLQGRRIADRTGTKNGIIIINGKKQIR